jgi:hypothetical protein
LEAVRASGRVFYRGDDSNTRGALSTCVRRVGEEYDLLKRGTYAVNDRGAYSLYSGGTSSQPEGGDSSGVLVADYFAALEGALPADPR